MPVDDGFGYGEHTELKREHFRGFVDYHLQISQGVMNKHSSWLDNNYWYFDLNAGPGRYTPDLRQLSMFEASAPGDNSLTCPDGPEIIGSPVVFMERAEARKVPYVARFFEISPRHAECLRESLPCPACSCGRYSVEQGDHTNLLPNYFRNTRERLGLVYSDESGRVPPFELLRDLSACRCNARLDLLIYVSATNVKRTGQRLLDHLPTINKKHWIIREPCGQHQWTFLFGTNWANFPAWEKRGFYPLNSAKGASIMRRLNSTARELGEAS